MEIEELQNEINNLDGRLSSISQTLREHTHDGYDSSDILEIMRTNQNFSIMGVRYFNSENITLSDNSTGGGGTITGNTAIITFTRADDSTKQFIFKKRAGVDYDLDNVLECYATAPAASRFNVWFNGRDGLGTNRNLGLYNISVNHDSTKTKSVADGGLLNGNFTVNLSRDGTESHLPGAWVMDSRFFYQDDTKSGLVSILLGGGTNGLAGLGYEMWTGSAWTAGMMLYVQDLTSIGFGGNLFPDADSAYDIGFTPGGRVNKIYATEIYCTTQTAGNHITGDLRFKDLFRIDEDESGLRFWNKEEKQIATLDQDGNLFIKGELKKL